MVRMPNDKWRMCMDFNNLNKACPKDSYHCQCNNYIIDFIVGQKLLSFMDAFLIYKHILMDKVDQEESCLSLTMAFITTRWFPST